MNSRHNDQIEQVKLLAKTHAIEFKDCGNGHIQLKGHGNLVNYWPTSKAMTAHLVGSNPVKNCRPYDAIKLCMGKTTLSPDKKPSKNGPAFDLKPIITNPAGIVHFYDGSRPPWEFDSLIMAQSDRLRIASMRIRERADAMDSENGQ